MTIACFAESAAGVLSGQQVLLQLGIQALQLAQLAFQISNLCQAAFCLPCTTRGR